MKNRRCPNRNCCIDYECGACEVCDLGNHILKLHKRIDRLKKQNETLTIQRNTWALTAKAVKEDTVRKIKDRLINYESYDNGGGNYVVSVCDIRTVAKDMLEGKNET